ncbi:hypothetical protein GJU41_12495 [Bacillus idriensis]|uniref:YokE-like PH domain-containing protein n=1 Tax=Metabacillus idriensis TaxID=324768 RepID=A0A6I2MBR6_9BACI|nr:PH domain-containing protein [Metabacillus idriensis]MRX54794.1 hypothetical protein [Metabacillus idriensis]
MAFNFRNEDVFNSISGKKRKASSAFKDTYYVAHAYTAKTNEVINEIVFGTLNTKSLKIEGLLLVTNRRLLFIAVKKYKYKMLAWNFVDIRHISLAKKFLGFNVTISTSTESFIVAGIAEGDHEKFITSIRKMTNKNSAVTTTSTKTTQKSTEKIIEEIRKYSALKDEGLLTEDEFAAKKKQLLGI